MKILIIGPFPPPIGGISIHIKRMKSFLESKKITVTVYNESKDRVNLAKDILPIKTYKKFIFKLLILKADVFHFHTMNKKIRLLLGVYKLFGKKIVFTLHGESLNEQMAKSNYIIKKLLLLSLKKVDKFICVNSKHVNELTNLGFDKNKLVCIPAYNNPVENITDKSSISCLVWDFINQAEFIICAYGCIVFNKSEDLYGFDLLIELINRLKKSGRKIKLIIALVGKKEQGEKERSYYEELKNRIIILELSKEILIYEAQDTEFYPILKESNLFIRPTNTDGYGVSLAEAIYYKVPAIASDVCVRPEGTLIFKSRDIEDLYEKTNDIINNYKSFKEKIRNVNIQDGSEKILEIYERISKVKR